MKDWTGSASYCTQWTAQQANAGRQVITGAQWDAADSMTKSLSADPCAQELRDQSTVLSLISGTWHDAATGLDIPVHCNLDFAPKSPGSLDMAIGSLTVTSDADLGTWTAIAYSHGMHIRAALKQALHAAATTDTRSTHLWCICERDEPFLTASRRATPELMTRANDTLAQLMDTYALCLSTQSWPAFDPSAAGSLTAWSQVFLEPWMTQGDAGAAGYFALGAVPTPP